MKLNSVRPLTYLLLLSLVTTGLFPRSNERAFGQSSELWTDEIVVQKIASTNPAEADRAVIQGLRRGERMFTLLLANKGDSHPFAGRFFEMTYGDQNCSALMSKIGGSAQAPAPKVSVTVEVVTLFLVSAIYYDQRLDFALYPHLMSKRDTDAWAELSRAGKASAACDYHLKMAPDEFEANLVASVDSHRIPEVNTPGQVEEAWKAVELWVKSFELEGLNRLRHEKRPPLGKANVRFIYTSVILGSNIEIGPDGDRVNPWLDPS